MLLFPGIGAGRRNIAQYGFRVIGNIRAGVTGGYPAIGNKNVSLSLLYRVTTASFGRPFVLGDRIHVEKDHAVCLFYDLHQANPMRWDLTIKMIRLAKVFLTPEVADL